MHPTHQAIWALDLVELLQKQGFSDAQIVGNTGVSVAALQGKHPVLSFEKLALLFERAAELTGDDLIGHKLGPGREFRRGGLVTFVGIASPNVRTLFENVSRYQRLISDAVRIDTHRLSEGITEWGYKVPSTVVRRQYLEFTATRVVDMLRRLSDRNIRLKKVELRHRRKSGTQVLEQFFGCAVELGADDNRLHLYPSDLQLELNTSDIYLHETLKECCEKALAEKRYSKSPTTLAVEQEIARGHTTQNAVATALAMSPRTLARRLSHEGTNFLAVQQTYREALSRSMIRDTELQMTEIAFAAGYSDLSTFSTAFHRWTGMSPTEYRSAA